MVDPRSITTTYAYDRLNRVTQRTYTNEPSGSDTPDVTYYYDDLTNAKGKLTKVTSSVSTTEYTSFDILGRVTAAKQTTDGGATEGYSTAYAYDLSGALIEETYPSTRKVKNVLDANGNLAKVESKKTSSLPNYLNYALNFTYNPAGAVTSMELGNGRWESTVFNSRLQPTQIALGNMVGATDKLKLDYTYNTPSTADNNGNVKTQKITVARSGQSDLVFDQTYTYDSLNRLQIAEEKTGTTSNWKQTFTFDRYGNRRFDQSNTTFPASFSNANLTNPTFNTSTNRFASGQNWTYDAAGNITVDPDGRTFTYDAENKQTEVKNSGSASLGTYFFDGDGKRVKKVVHSTGETTIFIYDAGGKLIAEYSTNVLPAEDAKVQYLTNDNLGTPRINTDANGAITSRSDYMPYGEEIVGLGGRSSTDQYVADDVRQGFTGYINDNETGLDFAQARMFSSSIGRFSSVDPLMASARKGNPKTWNRYAYTLNNPLKYTDPDGMEVKLLDKTAQEQMLNTLPEELRKQIEKQIKDGTLKKGSLDKIKSSDSNFLDLKSLVNSAKIVEVKTSNKFPNGDNFVFTSAEDMKKASIDAALKAGLTKEEANEEVSDIVFKDSYTLGNTSESGNGNFRVTLSDGSGDASTAPVWALAGAAAEELYVHALAGVQGKQWGHEYYTDSEGNENQLDPKGPINKRTREVRTRTENMQKAKGNVPTNKP